MRITRKFLQLIKNTCPHGDERYLKPYLPKDHETDEHGNYFYVIGENPTTMFTCHLDTVGKKAKVTHYIKDDIISTDGKTILGADDKAGMVVMLYMIEHKIPGLYYFFLGEECGCVGSGNLSDNWSTSKFSDTITKVVSFDRRGTTSIITHQWMGRCCSDEFGIELARRLNSTGNGLNMKLDDTGLLTDSAQFMELVSECTNISVGYRNEHTVNETLNIDYVKRLCRAVCSIDWETLPVKRTPEECTYYTSTTYTSPKAEYSPELHSYFLIDGEVTKMYIARSVINNESLIIKEWLKCNGYPDLVDIMWDGNDLFVFTESSSFYEYMCDRINLMDFIPELRTVSLNKLSRSIPDPFTSDDFLVY